MLYPFQIAIYEEEAAKNRPVRIPVAASEITDEAELVEFMKMRKKANGNGR